MSDLAKYHDHLIEQRPANFEMPPESDSHSTSDLIMGVLRRWYIVLLVFFVMCGIGIPTIWFSIEPLYSVMGTIRIAPAVKDLETDELDRGEIMNFDTFKNTEATLMTSSRVVQRVADNLADKNLVFFQGRPVSFVAKAKKMLRNAKTKPEPVSILKQSVTNGVINATADRGTELIKITMKSTNAEEAKTIVDAFISAYMAVEVIRSSESEGQGLRLLEDEHKDLAKELQALDDEIYKLAEGLGSKSPSTFDILQEVEWSSFGFLLNEQTKSKTDRIRLQTRMDVLKDRLDSFDVSTEDQNLGLEKLTTEVQLAVDPNAPTRLQYINANPTLSAYKENLTQLEQELLVARQIYVPTHQELKNRVNVIEALKESIKQREAEVGKEYDAFMAKRVAEAEEKELLIAKKQLTDLQEELKQAETLEQTFGDEVEQRSKEIIEKGQIQLKIQKLQDEKSFVKGRCDKIGLRIEELEFKLKRPEMISVADNADVASVRDKRAKYSMALMFGSMACGMLLAFLRDKADLRLRTPDDVVKRIGIRIIGTTTSSETVKKPLLPRQIAGDYQTIRANLRLLNGDKEPKMLVVTSPGMREGKTTFAINLAMSMAGSGKKVLLIDGDLRKPDVAHLLNLPEGSRGLQDVLFGRKFDRAVCSMPSVGLDVLAADSRNRDDACELLALPGARQRINTISQKYDHVIIDTPPVLAFPDALMWARMADAVILTSFARQTTAPDLREANEKLAQINVNVLGTILSNVGAGHSYYRYGHNYYVKNARSRENARRAAAKLLLPVQGQKDNNKDSDS